MVEPVDATSHLGRHPLDVYQRRSAGTKGDTMHQLTITLTLMLSMIGAAAPITATAAQLIVVEQKNCHWCRKWQQEVGQTYGSTPVALIAPLRRIDLHERKPADLSHLDLGRYTPTFILFELGREVGRIRGYPGIDSFWYILKQQLAKLQSLQGPKQAPIAKTNYASSIK
jgi:hypothetical protein